MANLKVVDAEQLEADLTSVADSIRAKTGGADALAFPSGFVNAVEGIESADSALAEVEYALTNGYKDYGYMFYNMSQMTRVPYEILQHISSGVRFHFMFASCVWTEIEVLDTSKGLNFNNMFKNSTMLRTIKGIDLTNATSVTDIFSGTGLQNIIFNGVIKITGLVLNSIYLTHDSLMSAINALYDYASEGSTSTYTLKLGSTNLAKLTDAEKAIATQKGWTLA